MSAKPIFIDTSGFYALLVKGDDAHANAKRFLNKASRVKSSFITSDYILDETMTLLMARGHKHLCSQLVDIITQSSICSIDWMNSDRFAKTQQLFLKYIDQSYSFTDCFSFILMKERKLNCVLSQDVHFDNMGFKRVI